MTNTKRLVPELRFPEFSGEWEKRKLKDIAKFQNGKAHEKLVSISGDFVLVNSKFISTNTQVKKFVSQQLTPLNKEDIAIVMSDIPNGKALAKCFLVNENNKYTLNQRIGRISDISGDSRFLYAILNRNTQLLKYDNGVGQTNLKKSEITHIALKCPINAEQKKIGDFFSKLDRQIELEEEKLELLEQQKRGYMQKIFSQELIFKDENGNSYPKWKSKKIKELFNVIDGDRGKNYPSEKDFYDKGHTLFLDTGNVTKNGFLFNRNRFIDKEKDDMLRKGKLELNDFVITSRGTLGNIGFYGQNIHHKYPNIRINSAMLILRPLNNKFNNQYLYFLLKNDAIDTFMKHYRVGSAQPHITKKDFGNMKISVIIDINEQRKIAKFLTIIDKLVINQSTKVELLKQRKQGLLQKMFI